MVEERPTLAPDRSWHGMIYRGGNAYQSSDFMIIFLERDQTRTPILISRTADTSWNSWFMSLSVVS